ncbi:MAG: hypothetical protein ICV81_00505 [Flavisolibacter sp.]|nr:hypothetical protein [Flavisolibacter sp.]MBD0294702.1 hypothetical protein [Flavisolibacter sp.]
MARNEKNNRPEAYPKPNKTDQQLNNQPEFMDQEPNTRDKDISDIPATNTQEGNERTRSKDKQPE